MLPPRARAARLALGPALALALAGAACDTDREVSCPGEPIGAFELQGTRNLDADPLAPPPCAPPVGSSDPIVLLGTLSADPETGGAAFCSPRPLAAILFGSRTGDAVAVEADTAGAVLGACGATCAASLHVALQGTITPDTGAGPGFTGRYLERLSPAGGDCGACALPCDAWYDVTGVPAP